MFNLVERKEQATMDHVIKMQGRRVGKTAHMERLITEHIRNNPDAVICRVRGGETIIEKPVKELGPARLPAPSETED
jgi:hypothetical protein